MRHRRRERRRPLLNEPGLLFVGLSLIFCSNPE